MTPLWKAFNKLLSLQRGAQPPTTYTPYYEHQDEPTPPFDERSGPSEAQVQAATVEVFHPVFALFRAATKNASLDVPSDIVVSTLGFMRYLLKTGPRERNCAETQAKFCELIGIPDAPADCESNAAARIVPFTTKSPNRALAALAFIEEKANFGNDFGNGEVSVQGFSYPSWWTDGQRQVAAQPALSDTLMLIWLHMQDLLNAFSCPSFIVSIASPWVAIRAAIFTNEPIVQQLTDYVWLGDLLVIEHHRVETLSRIFLALRLAMDKLRTYYADLCFSRPPNLRDASKFYPLATSCPLGDQMLHFRYVSHLHGADPANAAFLVESKSPSSGNQPGKLLVVKFVERYGPNAHKLLASIGYAPELLYCGPAWPEHEVPGRGALPYKMVVMDYIDGVTAFTAYSTSIGGIPDAVRTTVFTALRHLHNNGLVHGDIRHQNIVIENRTGDLCRRTKIIDFDWAGEKGTVRYPLNLSKFDWPAGVQNLALILPQHDVVMAGWL
ncbi:hypothetical protein V8D89_012137 [Ganoderma adspersum]